MKDEKRNLTLAMLAIPVILIVVALVAVTGFRGFAYDAQQEEAYNGLRAGVREQAVLVNAQLAGVLDQLHAFASASGARQMPTREETLTSLSAAVEQTGFGSMTLFDAAGTGVSNTGVEVHAADASYFRRALAGEDVLLRIIDPSDSTSRFVFAVTVRTGEQACGVLAGSTTEHSLRVLLEEGDSGDGGYTFVCDGDGAVIVGSDHPDYLAGRGNVLNTLSEGTMSAGSSLSSVAKDLASGTAGSALYSLVGRERYAVYEPLALNGWMMFRVIPVSIVTARSEQLQHRGGLVIALMLFVSLASLITVYFVYGRNLERLEADREQIRLSDERFRLALENSRVSIWDYDLASHSIIQPEHALMLHGSERVILNVPQSLVSAGLVHPDSIAELLAMYDRLNKGEQNVEGVFRLRRDAQGYWYQHIRYRLLPDPQGHPYRAIGMAEDVTERYEAAHRYQSELRQLTDLAHRDPLTGLLNRSAAERAITAALAGAKPENLCALYIVDLDGFKQVNDRLGHQRGDQTLSEIAQALHGVFRSTDITGRLGGDEFLVFLTASGAQDLIEMRAAELCSALQFVYPYPGGQLQVTASIGVAVCCGGCYSFRELYAVADAALYRAKHEGRARYVRVNMDGVTEAVQTAAERPCEPTAGIPIRTLLQYMDGGVILCEMTDPPHVLYASPGCFRFAGRDTDGTGLFDLVEPEGRPGLMSALRAGAETYTVVDCACRVREREGGLGWQHVRAVRIPYEGVSAPVMLAVVTDITELFRGREELRAANERLRFAFRQTHLLLWEYTQADGRLRFLEESGQEPDPVLALLRRALTEHADEQLRRVFAEVCAAPDFPRVVTLHGPEGDVRCMLRGQLLRDSEGEVYGVIGVAGPAAEETV